MVKQQALSGLTTWIKKMKIERQDWEGVIKECGKQLELMCNTLKNMKLAAELQGVTFEKAIEEVKKLPKKKNLMVQ